LAFALFHVSIVVAQLATQISTETRGANSKNKLKILLKTARGAHAFWRANSAFDQKPGRTSSQALSEVRENSLNP